ncbi:MAG TPA: heat shock protein HspQ [bacterium]|jgi:hemimethylated DNA binding protein|nr:heat shock protein HspQ [bacterium]
MDTKQLPHLLSLLDDDSPSVQAELRLQLGAMGDTLKIELARMATPPSDAQRRLLQSILQPQNRAWLRRVWAVWLRMPDSLEALEKACALISEFHSGYIYPTDLSIVLDQLAEDYSRDHGRPDALSLAAFLFKERDLKGNQADYFNPLNSDLVAVIKEKRGIPLSLSAIYMLVGRRLGLDIGGCHFPGHFLARVREGGREFLVDCFNGGVEVDHKVVATMGESTPWSLQTILNSEAGPRSIVARMLRNLAKAYEEGLRPEDLALVAELSVRMEQDDLTRDGSLTDASALEGQPRFPTGTVVRSRLLGFRAVVVDFDLSCKAPETWRRKRGGGARLDQPWYHLFVDKSEQVAYAPEENLEIESPAGAVEHPLLAHFFDRYENGKYWRNFKHWPGA